MAEGEVSTEVLDELLGKADDAEKEPDDEETSFMNISEADSEKNTTAAGDTVAVYWRRSSQSA